MTLTENAKTEPFGSPQHLGGSFNVAKLALSVDI